MNKKYAKVKSTRRSLMMSVLSLMLSVAMLLGTTYAWFTDTVTSGINQIIAGNLDIQVEYGKADSEGTITWKDLTGATDLFSDVTLWEPGVTDVTYLKIKNVGTLALKYQLGINILSETVGINKEGKEFYLHDFIMFGQVKDVTEAFATRDEARAAAVSSAKSIGEGYYQAGNLEAAKEEKILALVIYMPETVGNEANYMTGTVPPQIDMGLKVVATQDTVETDSFDKLYDKDAEYNLPTVLPEIIAAQPIEKTEDGTLKEAVIIKDKPENANVTATVPAGAKLVPGTKELKLVLTPSETAPEGAHVETIDPMLGTVLYYDIDIEGLADDNTVPVEIKLFVGKGFNNDNVIVYHKTDKLTSNYDAEDGFVTFSVPNFSPFTIIIGDGQYHIRSVEDLKTFAKNVNGGNTYAKKTIVLDCDLDLKNDPWTPIGTSAHPFSGKFDGKNHKISNLKVESGLKYPTPEYNDKGLFGYAKFPEGSTGAIKNIEICNADVTGSLQVGALVGQIFDQANSEISGIKITGDVKVSGYWYVGAVIGKAYICNMNNITIDANEGSFVLGTNDPADDADAGNIGGVIGWTGEMTKATYYNNISVNNLDVTGVYYVGGIAGTLHTNCILSDCTVSNMDINATEGYGAFAGRIIAPGKVDTASCTATNIRIFFADGVYQDGIDAQTYYISNVNGLKWFADSVNGGNTYEGKTVKLTADIDLNNEAWTPIGGDTMDNYPGITFAGTFDGQNKTIKNLTTSSNKPVNACAGLFGAITGTIQNVKLENVNVTSTHWAGAVVAYASNCGKVINCHVKGGTVTSVPELVGENEYDNGDKAGGIVGYGLELIDGCSVEGLTVTGYRDVGGIAGYIDGGTVSNNTVKDTTVSYDPSHNYKSYTTADDFDIEEIVGHIDGATLLNNTATNVVVVDCIEGEVTLAIASAKPGDTVTLPTVEGGYNTIALPEKLENVTIKGEDGITVRNFVAPKNAEITNLTIENVDFGVETDQDNIIDLSAGGIAADIKVIGGTLDGSDGNKYTQRAAQLSGGNSGSVEFDGSTIENVGRGIYASAGYNGDITLKNCTIKNSSSWAVQWNGTVTGDVVIDNCVFENCSGLLKGTTTGNVYFTNNLIKGNCGHDGNDNQFIASLNAPSLTFYGNKIDNGGVISEWTTLSDHASSINVPTIITSAD